MPSGNLQWGSGFSQAVPSTDVLGINGMRQVDTAVQATSGRSPYAAQQPYADPAGSSLSAQVPNNRNLLEKAAALPDSAGSPAEAPIDAVPQFSPPAALSGSYEANSNVASEVGVGNSPRSAGAFPPDSFFGGSGNIEQGQAVGGAPQALQQSNEALGMGSETRNSGRCIPQCFYQCEDVRCDEVCEPICKPATCETRCQSVDLSSCTEDCSHPQCRIDCPYRQCPSAQCPFCQTKCGQPRCVLKCPEQQPCNTVCEQPACTWKCRAPQACPKPKCQMFCQHPPGCMETSYQSLPPLQTGEVRVQSFIVSPEQAANMTKALFDKNKL